TDQRLCAASFGSLLSKPRAVTWTIDSCRLESGLLSRFLVGPHCRAGQILSFAAGGALGTGAALDPDAGEFGASPISQDEIPVPGALAVDPSCPRELAEMRSSANGDEPDWLPPTAVTWSVDPGRVQVEPPEIARPCVSIPSRKAQSWNPQRRIRGR